VIESKFARGHGPMAILAGVTIAHQDILAREGARYSSKRITEGTRMVCRAE
jgi:hypothetical protein